MPKLYGFQSEGVGQILNNQYATGETSALIADDMGLGKTVEGIALDLNRRRSGKVDYTAQTLVVTQTSVMGSWEKHYNEWAPWLKVVTIDRKNRQLFINALKARTGNGSPVYQVFVCHWQVLRFIADELKEVTWFHIIGDEIQNIKNRKAQQTRSSRSCVRPSRLG